MKIERNSTILFIGDSITDAGRAYPFGEQENIGMAYPRYFWGMTAAMAAEMRLRVINTGISGNTSRDLVGRWESDVLAYKPDYVSVMIGVNDVWRRLDHPLCPEMHVSEEEYARNLEYMIEKTQSGTKGMIFLSPFVLECEKHDTMRSMCDAYGAVMKDIALKHGVLFVDIQAAFDRLMSRTPLQTLTFDRVHPNTVGHTFIAAEVMKALEIV